MKRALKMGGLLVLVLLGTAFVYLALLGEKPSHCDYSLDAATLRELANALPGAKPRELRADRLTTFRFPRALVSAGESFSIVDMDVFAYQLVYDGGTILIDVGMSAAHAAANDGTAYDETAWKRLTAAIEQAKAIYVTHEHGDHIGGLLETNAWSRAHLLKEQKTPEGVLDRPMPAAANDAPLLEYDGMKALAPGLVAIRARGHTPGSQMFFVQRADGQELLLLGDVAWQLFAVERERVQPHLMDVLASYFDPRANACQLVAINKLRQSERIAIMPGHDRGVMEELVKRGLVTPSLQ